ncbi:hypothetical protein SERLA73DRAFT_76271 [Serpula lacrymans var. lacrymans S7.3]|uniref:Uncharacterized protein n=1 Tax=Serpula lacrymans var. lacrymans (strain S7.3) TaxID=936435 RepID=F8Q6Q5_SERL3|nr:hypothetical protein SERLA73DRAFT_76271 [Serpula lacrymans var. lacrymans S7.3]
MSDVCGAISRPPNCFLEARLAPSTGVYSKVFAIKPGLAIVNPRQCVNPKQTQHDPHDLSLQSTGMNTQLHRSHETCNFRPRLSQQGAISLVPVSRPLKESNGGEMQSMHPMNLHASRKCSPSHLGAHQNDAIRNSERQCTIAEMEAKRLWCKPILHHAHRRQKLFNPLLALHRLAGLSGGFCVGRAQILVDMLQPEENFRLEVRTSLLLLTFPDLVDMLQPEENFRLEVRTSLLLLTFPDLVDMLQPEENFRLEVRTSLLLFTLPDDLVG